MSKKLLNRCLWMCFSVISSSCMSVIRLHAMVNSRHKTERRHMHLLNIRLSLKQNIRFRKEGASIALTINTYVFNTILYDENALIRKIMCFN